MTEPDSRSTERSLTVQAILDDTAVHLAGMTAPATKCGRGAYRALGGRRCAVGLWLTDDEVRLSHADILWLRRAGWLGPGCTSQTLDDLRDSGVQTLSMLGLLPARLMPHVDLLDAIERAHDDAASWLPPYPTPGGPSRGMAESFIAIAIDHALDPGPAIAILAATFAANQTRAARPA